MNEKLYQMEDAKSNRVEFVGTEKECIQFSVENPDTRYIMTEVKDNGRSK